MGFLGRRVRAYRAAHTVETWRTRAEQVRREDPELYQQILKEAEPGEAAAAAARDPDAFVALWLAAVSENSEDDSGIPIPAWWYFWPDEADPIYQAELHDWQEQYPLGNEGPIPLRDPSRVVFLPENMPSELRGKSHEELAALGVQQVPGEHAIEGLIALYEAEHSVRLDSEARRSFITEYLAPYQDAIKKRVGESPEA